MRYQRRHPRHLDWIRAHRCAACSTMDAVVAHHVRINTDGATGLKPSDWFALPLCPSCHTAVHAGERSFEKRHQSMWPDGMRELALRFASRSPYAAIMRPALIKAGVIEPGQ